MPGTGRNQPPCRLLPTIAGLNTTVNPQQKLRVLGVILDPGLTMVEHVVKLRERIFLKMARLKPVSGSIFGPKLDDMRTLYMTSVRPLISYACGAWYTEGHAWSIHPLLIAELEKIQHECLLTIAGAYKSTEYDVLLKELCIDSVGIYLRRTAAAFRARSINTPLDEMLRARRNGVNDTVVDHPYKLGDLTARLLLDSVRLRTATVEPEFTKQTRLANAIKSATQEDAFSESSARWTRFRREYNNRPGRSSHPYFPALLEDWGWESLGFYENKNRAQCTMLMACRTGRIGLNKYLYHSRVSVCDT